MNLTLKQALDDYYMTIKENRPNYRTCYNSLLEYCDANYPQYSLSEMFENHINIWDIKQACKRYVETSKKATSIEAVQRFLTAVDYFCKYLKENNIRCEKLEGGCRKKKIVHDICVSLNNELEQKIYLPFDGEKELEIAEKQIALLNRKNFYQLGQSILYRLLITYGFKEKVIINLKLSDFDHQTGKLLVCCNGENSINVNLAEDIRADLAIYCALNKYQNRVTLFTKSNGASLTPDSIFYTLKTRMKKMNISNFTPTAVALYGVANLIEKGLTLGEIKLLTGFETQKIEDVSQYLLTDEDAEGVINQKIMEGSGC